MTKRLIVTVCGAALLIAAAVVVALRERQQAPPPEAPAAETSAEVRVKAVERKPEPSDHEVIEVSSAVAIVCGADSTIAEYEHKRHHIYARIPKSDRWDAEFGWVSPSADILCGTFEDIKNTLKTRGEKNAIYCQMGHTEVFEHGNVLVIATWSGDPSGNVYDIRLRAFDCDKIKGMPICFAGCNIKPSRFVGCSVHYVKVADRCFNSANACTVYYDGYNVWADIVYIGCEPCRYRMSP